MREQGVGEIKDTIKHMMETLINLYGPDVFTSERRVRAAMDEIFSGDSYKKSRNLLGIAVGQMKAYNRLKSWSNKEFLAIDSLATEMHKDYDIIAESAQLVMEAIGEVAASSVLRIDEPKAPIIGIRNEKTDADTQKVIATPSPDDPDTVVFGNYLWRVLKVDKKHLLIISEDIITCRDWGKQQKWHMSEIRGYLNGGFFNSFAPDERKQILLGSFIGRIFLLNRSEANAYFHGDSDRIAKQEGAGIDWWLCSGEGNDLDYVTKSGKLAAGDHNEICNETKGIRPALWVIDSKKLKRRR